MFMFMKEKTYRFHGSLQQFISELMTEHDRLRAIYGEEHFTCYLGEPSSDPLATYTRPRKLIYWRNQTTSEGRKSEMVIFYNLPSLDGENIKLRAEILDEPGILDGFPALARWQETESLWTSKKLMAEIKTGGKKPQMEPQKQKNDTSCTSVEKMIKKIAHRDCHIRKFHESPPWSLRQKGFPDKNTANAIDKKMGKVFKSQWDDPSISGETLVNLLLKKYDDCPNLKATWEKWKNIQLDAFL
jgi:hypothetical protein